MPHSTRRDYLQRVGQLGSTLTVGVLSGCQATGEVQTAVAKVSVASKPFTEQRILGYLAYHRLSGIERVQRVNEIGYGNSRNNWQAITNGTKDLYWEYTGTAWLRLPPVREERITDPETLYERVRADAEEQGLTMGTPAPFSNEFVLVVDREWSERTDVTTISDLVAHINAGNTDFGMAFGKDFYHREDGWQALCDYYGMAPKPEAQIEADSAIVTSIGLTFDLLTEDRVAVASGFNTDPPLTREENIVLEDDHGFFIPYQPVPTAHTPTVAEHPEVLEVLSPVASRLDESTMRALNAKAIVEGQAPKQVAQSYLEREGLLP